MGVGMVWRHIPINIYLYVSYHCIAQCVHCTVGFSCSQKSPVVTTGESPLLTGNNRGYFVVTTGEYFRKKHKFRFWDSRKSNFQAHWDKYMSNNMTVLRLDGMSHCARSKGKKKVQYTHCSLSHLELLICSKSLKSVQKYPFDRGERGLTISFLGNIHFFF